MGLDIFFLGRDRVCVTDAVVSVPETREVGYFRKVNPLIEPPRVSWRVFYL
ncbi:hypothetical protein FSH11_016035 [Escherichia coli]|nr:hypothetical protein [Escherichia coli]